MATIIIDGATYSGSTVSIVNGRVTIDGVPKDTNLSGLVEIRVTEGVLGELSSDAAVFCGEVRGSVRAGGSVHCNNVGGNVNAGGSVNCDNVGGGVKAGGSVHRG
ncbi:MAG TPA: hypothetical protein VFG62_12285 [Rhodopila sp.]|nr:hypothetical protein [Rhodopila sp.]